MARPKTLADDEKKSARLSLLVTPKLLSDVTTLAQIQKVSLNDLFTSLAVELVKKNRDSIDEVQQVMNKVAPRVELSLFDDNDIN